MNGREGQSGGLAFTPMADAASLPRPRRPVEMSGTNQSERRTARSCFSRPWASRPRTGGSWHAVAWIAVAASCLPLAGCKTWKKLTTSEKTLAEERGYGATADQRIDEFAANAKKAKAGSHADQVEFTQGLVKAMLDEHDPRVRCVILETAAEFETAAATAICKGALEDPDERVRMAGCTVWRKRGERRRSNCSPCGIEPIPKSMSGSERCGNWAIWVIVRRCRCWPQRWKTPTLRFSTGPSARSRR